MAENLNFSLPMNSEESSEPSQPLRPVLPQGLAYRHSLAIIVALALGWAAIFAVATISNYLNNSAWIYFWGTVTLTIPLLAIWRLLWLEKHGWWVKREIQLPDLPVEFRGIDWRATFETQQVIGREIGGAIRAIAYSAISRVEFDSRGNLAIIESGKVPLIIGGTADRFLIVALLAHYAPQAEFRGEASVMREGWQRQF